MQKELGLFDQVICFETIEHIMDDRKLVKNIAALLKSGGRLLLTTPYKYGKFWAHAKVSSTEDGGHVRIGYDENDLTAMFKEYGLQIARVDYLSGWLSQHLIRLDGFLNPRLGALPAWLIVLPFRIIQLGGSLLSKPVRYSPLSIAVVAEKSHTQ
jgi:SAM-dependent methyltransferase